MNLEAGELSTHHFRLLTTFIIATEVNRFLLNGCASPFNMETSGKNFKETGSIGTSRKEEIYLYSFFLPRSGKHFLNTTSSVGVF